MTTHVRKVVGSNTGAVYCMNILTFFHIDYKKIIVCLKRPKINEKEAGVGPFCIFLKMSVTKKQHFVNFRFVSADENVDGGRDRKEGIVALMSVCRPKFLNTTSI